MAALMGHDELLKAQQPNPVTAIDILLNPDATMLNHIQAANARLLKSFPGGFVLDQTHQPHISCLQRYVRTADLDKVFNAVGRVLANENPAQWKLRHGEQAAQDVAPEALSGIPQLLSAAHGLDIELPQMMIKVLVHQDGPLVGRERAEKTVWVFGAAIRSGGNEPTNQSEQSLSFDVQISRIFHD